MEITCNLGKAVIMLDTLEIRKIKKEILKTFIVWCVAFSIATILGSGFQLISGRETDPNIHILFRGLIVLTGVGFLQTFRLIKIKNTFIFIIVHYCFTMSLVFAGMWFSGFISALTIYAYRDIFLSYTIIYIIVATFIIVVKKKKSSLQD